MANSAAKKIHRSNQRRLRALLAATLLVNVLFGAVRGVALGPLTPLHKAAWGAFAAVYAAALSFLASSARATFDARDGALLHAGHDLAAAGLLEYVHDVLYVTLATHALLTVSRWALAIVGVAAVFVAYLAAGYVLGWGVGEGGAVGGGEGGGEEEDLAGLSRKERRKAERKQSKRQR